MLFEDEITLGLAFAMRASSRAWLSYSSLGAGAKVDHLHWEMFFAVPQRNSVLPFEAHTSVACP